MDAKLITFLKVIECQSYTLAAKSLHLTQPAVSQHIKKLEEEYQCSLFEDASRSLKLTKHGEIVRQHARSMQVMQNQLVDRLTKVMMPLTLGMTLSIADYYVRNDLFVTLYKNGYNCSIQVANTAILTSKILEGLLDCAIVEGIFNPNYFISHSLIETKFVAVAAKNHPLANKKIKIEDVFNYPIVLREEGSGTRSIFVNFLNSINYNLESFEQRIEMGSFKLIKEFVKHSEGISFVYEKVVEEEIEAGQLALLNIDKVAITRELMFIYHAQSTKAKEIESFMKDYLVKYI